MGVVVAGCGRADFPTPTEKLVLNIAVNQTVMTLHEVRRLREKEQLAQELDQRVAQRTRELVTVNEELRNEINDRKRAQLELWRKDREESIIFDAHR